jgi:hypothetical protein
LFLDSNQDQEDASPSGTAIAADIFYFLNFNAGGYSA